MQIIVARYNEDMDWTKQFPNVLIYNKGTKFNNEYNEIQLNNVGREGHTYFKHIYDNYENLEDYIIFLQGNPFDHSPDLIQNINKYMNKYNNNSLDLEFEYLSKKIIDCNLIGCRWFIELPLRDIYEKIFNERKEYMDFRFGVGAQFIVSKNTILKRPKSFYLNIIEILEKDVDPIEGHAIERFHSIIFGNPLYI